MTTTTEFTEADLPELPEPYDVGVRYSYPSWSNKQVVAYALAAVAASREKLMEQEPVGVTDMTGGIYWKRGAPIQAKLYAAPMPQANESEAVKALRRVVSNYETNCSVRDAWAWHEDSYNAARAVLAGEPGAKDEQPSIDCLACAVRNAQLEQTPNSEVTAEYLDWLRTDCRSEGVGGNEAWNAGVAWARANATAEQPKQAQAQDHTRPMVDMTPPATSRDRWMYEQGRLAERDPRTEGSLAAQLAQAQASGKASGYAYRYPGPYGGIRFNNGGEVNGSKPVETIPYWLGQAPTSGKAAPSDEEIDAVAASMPDGVGGMLKQWGYRQFARALLERYGKDGK